LAKNILANTTWPSLEQMAASLNNASGEGAPHNVSLLSRLFSLLQTPLHTIANAADEALAGHQSDDTDSVLDDFGKTIGGVATGGARGFAAGLRGTFGSDEAASDPSDRTGFGDVINRFYLHMPTAEALDPANRQEVIDRLTKAKVNQLGGNDKGNLLYMNGVGDSEVQDFFKKSQWAGLASDIVGDPTNFISLPAKGVKAATEIGEATEDIGKGIKSSQEALNSGYEIAPVDPNKIIKRTPGSYRITLKPGTVQNSIVNSTGDIIKPPEWFNFPNSADEIPTNVPVPRPIAPVEAPVEIPANSFLDDIEWPGDPTQRQLQEVAKSAVPDFDSLLGDMVKSGEMSSALPKTTEAITPVKNIADKLMLAKPEVQAKLAGKLARDVIAHVTSGRKGWQYEVADLLSKAHAQVNFNKVSGYLDKLAKNPEAVKNLARTADGRKRLVGNLSAAIADDVSEVVSQSQKVQKAITAPVAADQIVNKMATGDQAILARSAEVETKAKAIGLKPRYFETAQNIINHYTEMILGNKAAAGMKNPEAYNRAITSGKNVRYSGPQQSQMLNRIINAIPQFKRANDAARYETAMKILNLVETHFISKGAIPHSAVAVKDSVPLRLSEVMAAVGPQAIARDPKLMTEILRAFNPRNTKPLDEIVQQAVEEVKAGNAVNSAPAVDTGIKAGEEAIQSTGDVSLARMQEAVNSAGKAANAMANATGAGETGAKIAQDFIKNTYMPVVTIDTAIARSHLNTLTALGNDTFKNYAKYANGPILTRAIVRQTGLPWPRQLANKIEAKVPEWLGARFNAAYKNMDMREIYLREAATAKSSVAKRASYINQLVKTYGRDPGTWRDAMQGAQGFKMTIDTTNELSKQLIKTMENLFGSSGLRYGAALDNAVAGRSQLLMRELNETLKRYGLGNFKFIKSKDVKDGMGGTRDFSKGIDWLNSWEIWNITNPIDFLYRIQNAVETAVRQKNMFDDIAARWGNIGRSGAYKVTVNHPRFNGIFFTAEDAEQVNRFLKNLKEIQKPNSKPMQLFDNVLSKWKSSVTIYMPSHHIRNLIGDVYFNWMAGVNSTHAYTKALSVMRAQKGKYEGLEDIGDLVSPMALTRAIMRKSDPKSAGDRIALTMKNGTRITNDMIYVSAFQQGLLPAARVLEDIPDDAAISVLDKFRPLGGKGQKFAHNVAEGRDHYIRLAHYIDQINKAGPGVTFEQATRNAAKQIRKWHPDGMDLTAFERNVMRRIFPFYSWTRKALPLIIESIVSNPGKTMVYPKAMNTIQQYMGMDTSVEDPFPVDQLFPDWIRDKGVGPILGGPGSYGLLNPSNPMLDIGAQMSNPRAFVGGMVNPALQIPAEVMTGVNIDTGAPIQDKSQYITQQIPGISQASRLTNVDIGGPGPKYEDQGFGNTQNLINFLTAIGYLDTGPYQKSAQFDLKNYLRSHSGNS
jgi:hypothetical protein